MVIETVTDCGAGVVLAGRPRAEGAQCPRCGQVSVRTHSRYHRRLADAPVSGRPVQLRLQVRILFCDNTVCTARTFTEQPAALTVPRARRTSVQREALTAIAVALAGRAGARLAARLGMLTSRDTLLRLLRGLPDPQIGELPVIGVDDFALRRGHVYGTVVINVDTGRPVELLPDRDAAALAAWLRAQPEVEVICPDRAGAYAEAARVGAPHAVQVADRWHLWRNLGEAVEKTVASHRANLGIAHLAGLTEAPKTSPTSQTSTPPVVQPVPEKKIIVRMREQHTAVHDLVGQGMSKAAIGRRLGLHPATVRKLAQARTVDDLTAKTEQRSHLVDGYVEYLHRRWNEGERNATGLFREIAKLGYQGGELAVQRYLRRFRDGRGHAALPGPKPPTVREVTSWVMPSTPRRPRTRPRPGSPSSRPSGVSATRRSSGAGAHRGSSSRSFWRSHPRSARSSTRRTRWGA
jgi:transposase